MAHRLSQGTYRLISFRFDCSNGPPFLLYAGKFVRNYEHRNLGWLPEAVKLADTEAGKPFLAAVVAHTAETYKR